jgi:hypothetical protein
MVPQRQGNFEEDRMKNRFLGYAVALGLAAFLTNGGLFGSKAYGDIISCDSGCSLQYLIDNPDKTIQVGDKLFYNFDASSFAYGGAIAVPLDAIMVAPLTDTGPLGHTEYGLQFAILAYGDVIGGQGKDIVLEFDVTTTFGDNRIVDDYLAFSGGVDGGGVINISETVTDENGDSIPANGGKDASLYVFQDETQSKPTDYALFDPQDRLHINKDINWYASITCQTSEPLCFDRAFLSHFSQLFSQEPPRDIPEPSSMLLLGLGLAGLGIARRIRSAK